MARIKSLNERERAVNTHSVPQRQWRKWTLVAKHVFNKTYSHMMSNPEVYFHPDYLEDPGLPDLKYFRTTAWNAAWMAADICSRGEKIFLDKMKKEIRS